MPKSFEVQVEPSVLEWARVSAGWTIEEIGEKLNKSGRVIESWEAGDENPTLSQLSNLADYYKRPLAALLLPEPPKEPPLPHDFRSLQGENTVRLSPKTRFAMRRARRLQLIAKDLMGEPLVEISKRIGSAGISDNPELLAQKSRDLLGIEIKTQFDWKDNREALRQWIYSIERLGILVFQMSMPIEEARAFSLLDKEIPVIVINTQDSVNARIFSLFHELGHILLNKDGVCNPSRYPESSAEIKSIEVFCNRFAGAVLIPMDQLLNHTRVKRAKHGHEWQDKSLRSISKDFKVSPEVVLRRLLIANLTSVELYKKRRDEWNAKDVAGQQKKRKGGVRNIPTECVQRNGLPLTSLVIDSYKNKKITKSDVADYLDIRLKHLPGVERVLGV